MEHGSARMDSETPRFNGSEVLVPRIHRNEGFRLSMRAHPCSMIGDEQAVHRQPHPRRAGLAGGPREAAARVGSEAAARSDFAQGGRRPHRRGNRRGIGGWACHRGAGSSTVRRARHRRRARAQGSGESVAPEEVRRCVGGEARTDRLQRAARGARSVDDLVAGRTIRRVEGFRLGEQ
jgi:hypothetical protein